MPKFQLHDTVALKRDSTFIGDIDRTSQWDQEPLAEVFIILHTDIPDSILNQFLATGTPPIGFVFVEFASQEKGSSLVAEDDLYLINRDLEVGDVVKEQGSQMTGNVIDISSTYTLDPVWEPQLSNEFAAKPAYRCLAPEEAGNLKSYLLNPDIRHPQPQRLISNVPFEELKRAQDFIEGDYVIESEWLGHVNGVMLMVVIKLENNSVVIVAEPGDLFIPIPEYDRRVVPPSDIDGIPRPPYVSARPGWERTIPPEDLECGQFVVTSLENVMHGRFLRGSYDPKVKPEGHVLMVRCRQLGVDWLICNAYTPHDFGSAVMPGDSFPYDNLDRFYAPQEIRRDRQVTLYDPSKPARRIEDRTREGLRQAQAPVERSTNSVTLSSSFSVGQRVKFRDAAGAAMKYQGQAVRGDVYGRFARILPSETFGYDLNEFEVIYSQQEVTVRWQDGSITQHRSVDLDKNNLFEADLTPADIVVARHHLKMRQQHAENEDYSAQPHPLVDFNEMAFFEKPHELLALKVGIIQNVDSAERLARIRWFQNPSVWITTYGNALGGSSRFGPISDIIEDVSLYEVMTFGGLMRRLREIVIIPPSSPSVATMNSLSNLQHDDLAEVNASMTTLSQLEDRNTLDLLEWMQHNAYNTREIMPVSRLTTVDQYKSHRSVDWVGEICELRTDGHVIVRVSSGDQRIDVKVEHDQLLAIIDEVYTGGIDHLEDPMDIDDIDDSLSQSSNESVLSETVEYEGGERLDDDSGDENWESEDELEKIADRDRNLEMKAEGYPRRRENVTSHDATTDRVDRTTGPAMQSQDARPATHEPESNQWDSSVQSLASFLPDAEPPSFLSLERGAPPDQFRCTQEPSTSTAFLKRIAREHRILSTSLPHREIYVRTYDSRLDLLRCLIIGPLDTPYEYAPFIIDLHLGPNFPREPPTAHFHSWTSGLGRINPNLYEEGKICLSLLGTWPGKSETEGWTEKATILQLLVSLQGLVFVKAPFYNEAGFEGYEDSKEYTNESLLYSEKAYVMSRKFVKHALKSPVGAMEDILAWTYLPRRENHGWQLEKMMIDQSGLLGRVTHRANTLMIRSEEVRGLRPTEQPRNDDGIDRLVSGDGSSDDETKVFMRPLSRGAMVMLRGTLDSLVNLGTIEIKFMLSGSETSHNANVDSAGDDDGEGFQSTEARPNIE